MLQVLPLALELVYEPRDPYRVIGAGDASHRSVSGKVGQEPGRRARRGPRYRREAVAGGEGRYLRPKRRARVEEWFEQPGFSAIDGAPRASLLAAVDRVLEWTRNRLAVSSDERAELIAVAHGQARAFRESLENGIRGSASIWSQFDSSWRKWWGSGCSSPASYEQSGRLDHVSAPAGLRCSRDVVVWWHCVSGTDGQPAPHPWRRVELAALEAAGIDLPDRFGLLAAEAESWRRPVLAARQRLVLVTPRHGMGSSLDAHPIVDEIWRGSALPRRTWRASRRIVPV